MVGPMERRTELILSGLAGFALAGLTFYVWQRRKGRNEDFSALGERGPRRQERRETAARDVVQEASEESFPASDAPAW